MPHPREGPVRGGTTSGSALLLSTLAGAALGAAGLSWWLLAEARRRRRMQRQLRLLQLSRLQAGAREPEALEQAPRVRTANGGASLTDRDLQQRVQRLNAAIDEVRRQLEELQPLP
jgi:hypothetical protein